MLDDLLILVAEWTQGTVCDHPLPKLQTCGEGIMQTFLVKLLHIDFDDNKIYLCANLFSRSIKSSHELWKKKKEKLAKNKLIWKIKTIQLKIKSKQLKIEDQVYM